MAKPPDNAVDADAPGGQTFFSLPYCLSPARGQVGLLGVGVDEMVTEHHGAADAPRALRLRSGRTGRYSVTRSALRKDSSGGAADLGDLRVGGSYTPAELFEAVHRAVSAIKSAGARPLLVGGDHSITYPAVTAVAEAHGSVRIIQIDAHVDATDPVEWDCRWNHGTWLRNLIQDGTVDGKQVWQVGVRDFQHSAGGPVFAGEHGVHTLTADDFAAAGVGASLTALLDSPGRPTYVTLDIDAVDPAFAPGAGEPMPGGLSSREVLGLVRAIFGSELNVVGADLVEVVPGLDCAGITVALASNLLAEMMDGLVGDRMRNEQGG